MRLAFWPTKTTTAALVALAVGATLSAAVSPARAQGSGASSLPAASGRRYANRVNARFATVSDGPQSSLIVDVPKNADATAIAQAVRRRVQNDWKARARAVAPQIARLRKQGLLKGRGAVAVSTLVTVRQNGRLVIPTQTRGVQTRQSGNALTFTFSGYDARAEQFLRNLVAVFYPRIEALYGAPYWSGNVEVVNAGDLDNSQIPDAQRLAFGSYDVSNRRILLPLFDNTESQGQALLLNMLHAFHGPAVFQYDAWEQGFARAAASVIARQVPGEFGDASANNLLSLLKFYDVLNQPTLGNPTFFPPSLANTDLSGFTLGKMFFPRLAMSGAVWLKVYVENTNFFRQFNEAYYAQAGANPAAVAGNVPALRNIARAFAANVEGQAFDDWFVQQFILDTSVIPGKKLYAFVLPSEPTTDATGGGSQQSVAVTLDYFNTRPNGDEDLLSGRAYASYFDATNSQTFYGPASEQADIADGEGFLTVLFFPQEDGSDATRLTMDFHVGAETARTFASLGVKGDFQVVVVGQTPNFNGKSGRLRIVSQAGGTNRNGETNLLNAAGGVTLGTEINELAATTITILDASNNVVATRRVNTGDGSYVAVVRLDGSAPGSTTGLVTVTHAFPAGLNLASFPVRPLASDIAAGLGLDPNRFVLSFYDAPNRTYQTFAAGQASAAPIQPGRGYFLKSNTDAGPTTVTLTGYAPPRDTDVTVSLTFGWNLVGMPFGADTDRINVRDLSVQYLQNGTQSFEDAVANNLVAETPFGYNQGTGVYLPIGLSDGAFVPWQGYWVRVLVPSGITLVFPAPDANRSRAAGSGRAATLGSRPRGGGSSATPAARPDWSLRLQARGPNGSGPAAVATFGVAKNATVGFDNRYDREAPPALAPTLALGFPHADWGTAAGTYLSDFRDPASVTRAVAPGLKGTAAWDVTVTSPVGGPVTLSWDGQAAFGRGANGVRLALVDLANGTRVFLRDRSSYTFTATAGQTRAFKIEATPARSRVLTVSDVILTRSGGRATGGATRSVSFTLSDDAADVTVELQTLGGQTVRRSALGRAQKSGRQTVRLVGAAGRGEGVALAPGPYVVRISAQDTDGRRVLVTRPAFILE